MEIKHLQSFLMVAREGNISKAAAMLHITQPALSRQLLQLEEETGTQLFQRNAHKIILTEKGQLLCRRAEEILELVEKTKTDVTDNGEKVAGEITIGCGELYSSRLLAEVLHAFRQKYPQVIINLHTGSAEDVERYLDEGLFDAAVMLEPVHLDKYDYIRLPIKERWVLLMPPDDPLTAKNYITPQDLTGLPLIGVKRQPVRGEIANWLGVDLLRQIKTFAFSNLPANAAMMVQEGLGYALVVEGIFAFWDKRTIACRPLKPEITATSILAWKKHLPNAVAATKFTDFAHEYFKNRK